MLSGPASGWEGSWRCARPWAPSGGHSAKTEKKPRRPARGRCGSVGDNRRWAGVVFVRRSWRLGAWMAARSSAPAAKPATMRCAATRKKSTTDSFDPAKFPGLKEMHSDAPGTGYVIGGIPTSVTSSGNSPSPNTIPTSPEPPPEAQPEDNGSPGEEKAAMLRHVQKHVRRPPPR
jgi:hypothetical protein